MNTGDCPTQRTAKLFALRRKAERSHPLVLFGCVAGTPEPALHLLTAEVVQSICLCIAYERRRHRERKWRVPAGLRKLMCHP